MYGAVAQLGERLLCKQEVVGSIPITSRTLIFGIFNAVLFENLREGNRYNFEINLINFNTLVKWISKYVLCS